MTDKLILNEAVLHL